MTAITLRNIPIELQDAIRRRAQADGVSLNRTVQRMLEEYSGLRQKPGPIVYDDLDHLAGTWTEEEADSFDAALTEQRRIDPELWE